MLQPVGMLPLIWSWWRSSLLPKSVLLSFKIVHKFCILSLALWVTTLTTSLLLAGEGYHVYHLHFNWIQWPVADDFRVHSAVVIIRLLRDRGFNVMKAECSSGTNISPFLSSLHTEKLIYFLGLWSLGFVSWGFQLPFITNLLFLTDHLHGAAEFLSSR
jgi:hypothetical protein